MRRSRRRGDDAQAVLETALVIPILLFLICNFVAVMVQVTVQEQLNAATALEAYDRRMSARFRSKDVLSWLLQLFVEQPRLLDHTLERLARRPQAGRTFARVMADLVPASRALEPGFLAAVLAP